MMGARAAEAGGKMPDALVLADEMDDRRELTEGVRDFLRFNDGEACFPLAPGEV